MNKILLCEHCINGITSHGEKLFVGGFVSDEGVCEFCGDEDELRECFFALDDCDE